MGAVSQPNLAAFKARYPEFAGMVQPRYEALFTEATLYHANDGTGPVDDPGQQLLLLNMLTAHLASLNALGADGQLASTLAGPIASASEGSVSVGVNAPSLPGSQAWWAMSRYGLAYLNATAAYRAFQYVPGPRARYGGCRRW